MDDELSRVHEVARAAVWLHERVLKAADVGRILETSLALDAVQNAADDYDAACNALGSDDIPRTILDTFTRVSLTLGICTAGRFTAASGHEVALAVGNWAVEMLEACPIGAESLEKWSRLCAMDNVDHDALRARLDVERLATSEPRGEHISGPKGVSLRDAALIMTEGDGELAKEVKRRWENQREPKLPNAIGIDPRHKQRKLFKPSALSEWVESVEGVAVCAQHGLRKRLVDIARAAAPEKTV
jgi:hypothetical protein